jgi:hypothetical protein
VKKPIKNDSRGVLISVNELKLNYDKSVETLGKITVEFQVLETQLKAAIGMLLDPVNHRLGLIVTAQLSFKATLDLLGALYEERFGAEEAEQDELANFLDRCNKIEDRRNQIVHSQWMPDYDSAKGALRVKFTARRRLKTQVQIVSVADLEKEADDLRALRENFLKVWLPRVNRYRTAFQRP